VSRTVAIVGGGISGLAAAEALERRAKEAGTPIRAIVLEAEPEPGGKIRSRREEGFVLDTGPHGFLDKEPKMFELIDRLGLRPTLLAANEAAEKRFVMRAGRLRELPSSPPKFLTSDVLPLVAKLRVLREPWAERRPEREESVWEFAARRIGPVAADVLVDAMVTGIYGGDPKRLSLSSAFPRMFELESMYGSLIKAQIALAKEKKGSKAGGPAGTLHSFTEGLGEMTSALAKRCELRTGAEVERIERGARWTVRHRGGSIEADAVVLAVPAFIAERLLGPHAEAAAKILGGVGYADVAVVIQCFDRAAIAGDVNTFGFLIPNLEERPILGTIMASSVFPEHAPEGTVMLRTILGGVRHPEHAEGDDETLFARARAELERILAIRPDAKPLLQRAIRWKRGIPQYDLGHRDRVSAADEIERTLPGMFVIGNAFRGVAMLSCVAEADRLAARAVERVLQETSPA
jgi:oxygen-dependent protoporphyrinogen oxidase